jgi:undecaprenyl-diphosphatase
MQKKTLRKTSAVTVLIIIEIFTGTAISILSSTLFFQLAENIDSIQSLDMSISQMFAALRSPFLTNIMIFISYLGQELLVILLVVIMLLLVFSRRVHEAIIFALIFVTGIFLNIFLKEFFGRGRPVDTVVQEVLHSFPSLHAMNSFIFYSLVVLYIYRLLRNKRHTLVSFCICSSIILLVGISRIYLGAHYFSDVVAGYVAGLWWVVTVLVFDKTLHLFREQNKRTT